MEDDDTKESEEKKMEVYDDVKKKAAKPLFSSLSNESDATRSGAVTTHSNMPSRMGRVSVVDCKNFIAPSPRMSREPSKLVKAGTQWDGRSQKKASPAPAPAVGLMEGGGRYHNRRGTAEQRRTGGGGRSVTISDVETKLRTSPSVCLASQRRSAPERRAVEMSGTLPRVNEDGDVSNSDNDQPSNVVHDSVSGGSLTQRWSAPARTAVEMGALTPVNEGEGLDHNQSDKIGESVSPVSRRSAPERQAAEMSNHHQRGANVEDGARNCRPHRHSRSPHRHPRSPRPSRSLDSSLPGAYCMPGELDDDLKKDFSSASKNKHGAGEGFSGSSSNKKEDQVPPRGAGHHSPNSSDTNKRSSRVLVNAVLVGENDSSSRLTVQEQEEKIAKEQARLQAWEEQLLQKQTKLDRLQQELEQKARGVITVQAEVVESSPTTTRGSNLSSGIFINRLFGSPRPSQQEYQQQQRIQREDESCFEWNVPLTMAQIRDDRSRSDLMADIRAEVQVAKGTIQLSAPSGQAAVDSAQLSALSRSNKRVLKGLLHRFEAEWSSMCATLLENDANTKPLAELAIIFKDGVPTQNRRYRLQMYPNCFLGKEAVDFLVRSQLATSRHDAVIIGRRLQSEMFLFEHVITKDHEFKDEELFYRFVHPWSQRRSGGSNSNQGKYQESKLPELPLVSPANDEVAVRDSDRLLESSSASGGPLPTKSTVQSLSVKGAPNRPYDSSSSATTDTTKLSTASTSQSNWTLPQIAEKLRNCLSVKNRRYRMRVFKDCFVASDAVDFMVRSQMASTRRAAVKLGQQLEQEFNLWRHVTHDHMFQDQYLFFRFSSSKILQHDDSEHSSEGSSSHKSTGLGQFLDQHSSSSHADGAFLRDVAEQLMRGVSVADRTWHLKRYRNVFVGCEAVDFLVQSQLAPARDEAVELGRRLEEELNLFRHVTKGHPFKDEYKFYRFQSSTGDDFSEFSSSTGKYLEGTISSVSHRSRGSNLSLDQIGNLLRDNVQVKTRTYHLKEYKDCFVGSEAVDYLVRGGIVSTREDAVGLARQMASELGYITHVCGDHVFEDDYLFYRFKPLRPSHRDTSIDEIEEVIARLQR